MKARELRIGNWVQGEPFSHFRLGIHSDGTTQIMEGGILHLAQGQIEYKPILLTQQWLEKFGWIWNKDCNSFEKYPNGDARMHLQFHPVNSSYSMFNYVLKALICDRIFYVHQLQNLYFALTQEELIIK